MGTWKTGESWLPFGALALMYGGAHFLASQLRLHARLILSGIRIDTVKNAKILGFRRITQFPLDWHARENVGSRMHRIQTGVASLRDMLRMLSTDFFRTFVPMTAAAVILISLDWRFALFGFCYLALTIGNDMRFYKPIKFATDEQNRAGEKSSGTSIEGAGNILTLKALGAEQAMINTVIRREELVQETSYTRMKVNNLKWRYFQGFNGFCYAAFFLLLGYLFFTEHSLTTGMVVTTSMYFARLVEGVSDGSEIISNITEHISGVGRMMPIYQEEIPEDEGTEPFPTDWQELRVIEARFVYPGKEHPSLRSVNLVIRRGQITGVAGASGGGKSTLTKLILGLHRLTEGRIEIDGIPLHKIRRDEATKHIAVVLQETELFNSSVLENITLCQEVPDDVLERAIRIAQLGNVLDKLPEGLDTIIGPKGYKLSGGERQRIGIARAMCTSADTIILDEATSHLDSMTEQAIQTALETEMQGKTLVIIAHRLSTLINANRIYVLRQGELIESGTFPVLAGGESHFADMCRIQGVTHLRA